MSGDNWLSMVRRPMFGNALSPIDNQPMYEPPRQPSAPVTFGGMRDAIRGATPQSFPGRVVQGLAGDAAGLLAAFEDATAGRQFEQSDVLPGAAALFGWGSAPQGALGSGASTRYVRRSKLPDTPINNGVGHAMFLETKNPRGALDDLSGYGPYAWITRGDGAVPVEQLQPAIVRALRNAGHHTELNTTAAQLAREAAPRDIVDGAGLWDNTRLIQTVWDDVLEPQGITAVKTPDGLILFDPAGARRITPPRL